MKYTVGKSDIQGKGLFAKQGYKKGEIIGLSHVDNKPTRTIGKYHNHSDKPTAVNIKKGNQRFLIANTDIPAGVEITTNYRKQPELEQPEDFKQEEYDYADDLTPEQIQEYAEGGYIIEDISVPTLNRFDNGGEPKRKKERFAEGTYDPNETAGYMLTEDEVVVPGEASAWGKARSQYKKQHPEEKFIERKKKQYLKRNPGLNKLYGVSMDNFPEDVETNFRNEYDYKTNTAVVKKVARKEGWNPNKREQYIDDLNDTQKSIVADSKYGSKLQAGYWNRALAGVQELGNTLLPGKPFKYNIPGLTKREQKEIRNDDFGAFEVFAPTDIPGVVIANFLKNRGLTTGSDYKDLPALYSGEKMGNVSDIEAMAFNPLTYYELPALPGAAAKMVRAGAKGLKALPGAVKASKESGLLSNAYKLNPKALKENPEMYLYRARPVGQDPDMNMAAVLKAKQDAGEELKWYQKNLLNTQTSPEILAREKYHGQWFEKDPSRLEFYLDPATRNFADSDDIEILRTKLLRSEADKFNVSQFDDAKVLSASPKTEFILPKSNISSAERFPESSWQQLIQEDKAFNTPHWFKGYKDVPKELPGSPNTAFFNDLPNSEIPQINPRTGLLQVNNSAMLSTPLPRKFVETHIPDFKSAEGLSEDMMPYLLPREELMKRYPFDYMSKDELIGQSFKSGLRKVEFPEEIPASFNTQEDIWARALGKPLPKRVSRASQEPKIYYDLNGDILDQPLKSGFINPFEIADAIIPNVDPFQVTQANSLLDLSPLNFIPIGKQLRTKGNAYRKFGNTLKYVQESKSLSPKGGILPRIGKKQIEAEGNWAALNEPWEKYPGAFTAEFDFKAPGSNLGYRNPSNRAGVLITDADGKTLPDIPLTDPGLSFHRRLPFSNRYIPIDKQKLLDNKFQMATQGAHLQSLAEKYGYGLAYAGLLGAMGNDEAIETYDKYTIDPVIKEAKKLLKLDSKKEKDGGVIEIELSDAELEEYIQGGYIIEKIQ